MSQILNVKPATAGLVVRMPERAYQPMPEAGATVNWSPYYVQLLRMGDLVEVSADTPAPVAAAVVAAPIVAAPAVQVTAAPPIAPAPTTASPAPAASTPSADAAATPAAAGTTTTPNS